MRWTVLFFLFFSFNQLVYAENNPFAKKTSLSIGEDVKWRIAGGNATKTASDNKGQFYHLMYDEKQLRLSISTDKLASQPKKFSQFEVIDVLVDNKRLALFNWCLNNQSEHSRYLQQGLSVKNDVCVVAGNRGQVTLWLDAVTVASLNKGENLTFVIKPYRASLSINYELTDFSVMQAALARKSSPPVAVIPSQPVKQVVVKQLADANALAAQQKQQRARALALKQKKQAEKIAQQKQLAKEQQLKEKNRQVKELEAARVLQAQQQALEGERLLEEQKVAANAAKQSELGVEITVKMVAMCQKYWDKGEHRCYCQKFIEYAPESIQEGSSCQ